MNPKIWLSSPHMGEREFKFVREAFETNWIAPLGPNVDGFEKDIEKCLGQEVFVSALSSGTAALHLALILLGVTAGDEVICQSMTFSASANPIRYQGALPVFVDSEPDTWNMCPDALRGAIEDRIKRGKKPKAIIVVHLYGMPAKIEEIVGIAGKYQIPLIEDAAEALGSSYKGRALGTFGDIGVLSFNGNKIITTSGGGALISKTEDLVKKSRFLATQARDTAAHYQHSEIGYNYRMSNVCAGIGRGQMIVLGERVNARRANNMVYKNRLNHIAEIDFLKEPEETYYSNFWLTTILINHDQVNPSVIQTALGKENIEARPLWKPMHMQPVFEGCPYYGDGMSERLFMKGLCLPSGSNLTNSDLDRVIESIGRMFDC